MPAIATTLADAAPSLPEALACGLLLLALASTLAALVLSRRRARAREALDELDISDWIGAEAHVDAAALALALYEGAPEPASTAPTPT